jgi:TRAP-type transport system small permease protein
MPSKLDGMEHVLNRIVQKGMWVSSGATAIMVLLLVTDVSMRTSINRVLPGTVELVELFMVITVFMAVAYTSLTDGLVSVELVYTHSPKWVQLLMDGLANFCGMLIYAVFTWQIGIRAWDNLWSVTSLETAMLRVPVYPFLFMAALGSFLLCLQLWVKFCRCISNLLGKENS